MHIKDRIAQKVFGRTLKKNHELTKEKIYMHCLSVLASLEEQLKDKPDRTQLENVFFHNHHLKRARKEVKKNERAKLEKMYVKSQNKDRYGKLIEPTEIKLV